MNRYKYITVLINSDNNVYLPHNIQGKSPLFNVGVTTKISSLLNTKAIKFGAFNTVELIMPFDFGYIFGCIRVDNIEQNSDLNTILNINKMIISKIVPSWNSGDILNNRTVLKNIKDIDYNALCREVTIDGILE